MEAGLGPFFAAGNQDAIVGFGGCIEQFHGFAIAEEIDFDQMGLAGEEFLVFGFVGVAAISGAFVGGGEDFDRGDDSACGDFTDFEVAFFDF